jgi:hypothetical protein
LFKKDIIQINSVKIDKAVIKAIKKDLPVTGTCVWENTEINKLLELYGLPEDSALSIVTVEVFGNIKSLREHITNLNQRRVRENIMESEQVRSVKDEEQRQQFRTAVHDAAIINDEEIFADVKIKPLSNGLGHYRILRTSPLTEVPFVCCPC